MSFLVISPMLKVIFFLIPNLEQSLYLTIQHFMKLFVLSFINTPMITLLQSNYFNLTQPMTHLPYLPNQFILNNHANQPHLPLLVLKEPIVHLHIYKNTIKCQLPPIIQVLLTLFLIVFHITTFHHNICTITCHFNIHRTQSLQTSK